MSGLDCDADDYVIKPFAFEELLVRSLVLLRRADSNESTVLRTGDLEWNPSRGGRAEPARIGFQ